GLASKGPWPEPRRVLVQQHERRPLARRLVAVGPPVALPHDLAVDRHVVLRHRDSLAVGSARRNEDASRRQASGRRSRRVGRRTAKNVSKAEVCASRTLARTLRSQAAYFISGSWPQFISEYRHGVRSTSPEGLWAR